MSRPISKINKLIVAESFIQAHFVKGYKYIDKAGEIINYFHDEKGKAPLFSMGLNGLDIQEPSNSIQEIKITSNSFWAHSMSPDTLEIVDSFFMPKARDIIDILEVEEISRIGWRNFFVYECVDEDERDEIVKKFTPIDALKFEQSVNTAECKDFSMNIRVGKVNKKAETEIPSLLIDVDTYKKFDPYLDRSELHIEFQKLKDVIRSDEFLGIMNGILA